MKFGVNTLLWTASFGTEHLRLLPLIKEAGFDAVEVAIFRPKEFPSAALRLKAAEYGLEVTVCSVIPNGFSMLSADGEVRSATKAYVEEVLHTTADIGAKIVAGPLYAPVGELPGRRRTPDEWLRAVEIYQSLAETLESTGISIAIEPLNRFETFFLNTAEDAVRFCDEIGHPNVGLLLDTFHANIEEKSIPDAFRRAARHLKHVHTSENDRGIPGTGHVDWPGVFQELRAINYRGHLTIESFGFAISEIAAAASIWRDLATTPEQIAWDGVRFLKQLV